MYVNIKNHESKNRQLIESIIKLTIEKKKK